MMKGAVWGFFFLMACCGAPMMAYAAMNPGPNSADEIVHERDNIQAMTPEQIQVEIYEARAKRNAELRKLMREPPSDFPHYAHPPILNQADRSWKDQIFLAGEPMPILVVKILAFIVIGSLLLSWLVHRIVHQTSDRS